MTSTAAGLGGAGPFLGYHWLIWLVLELEDHELAKSSSVVRLVFTVSFSCLGILSIGNVCALLQLQTQGLLWEPSHHFKTFYQ